MTDDTSTGRPNKSARKRELSALQGVAERMLGLSDRELERLGVGADLRNALDLVRPMRASGARNRQLKHCVKLMDADELQPVVDYLDNRQSPALARNQMLHAVERWRDRLVAQGDGALSELIDLKPGIDRQQLRSLVRDAVRERDVGKPAGAARKLFRWLRDTVFDDDAAKNINT